MRILISALLTGWAALCCGQSKVSDLPNLGSPASGDLLYAVDVSGPNTSSKLTVGTLNTWVWGNPTGQLPVANGGTGASSASSARTNLGLGALATVTPGTGIATALAVNVGSSGAPVILGGALGTPSSGVGTNLTGVPLTTGITGVLQPANGGVGGSTPLSVAIAALSPTAYWRLNDTSGNFLDSGGGGYTATLTGSVNRAVSALLPDAAQRYAEFTATTGAYGQTSSLLGLTPPLTGSWSVIAVVRPVHTSGSASRYIFGIWGTSSNVEAHNYQVLVYLESNQLKAFWEYGAGTNETILGPAGLNVHQTYVVHVVKDTTIDTVYFYINGVKFTAAAYANEPTGGSSAVAKVMGSTGSETAVIAGEVAFFSGTAHTQSQVESIARAAGMLGR